MLNGDFVTNSLDKIFSIFLMAIQVNILISDAG